MGVLDPPSPACAIRIGIVSGSRFYREGLARLLAAEPEIAVVASLAPTDVPEQVPSEARLVLLDGGEADGLAIAGGLAAHGHVVLVAGIVEHEEEVVRWARAGASGYVPRTASIEELGRAVRGMANGELYCSPRLAAELMRMCSGILPELPRQRTSPNAGLTQREVTVLRLVERGLSNKEIAAKLFVGVSTVKTHVHNALSKLGCASRTEAAAWVRDARLGRA